MSEQIAERRRRDVQERRRRTIQRGIAAAAALLVLAAGGAALLWQSHPAAVVKSNPVAPPAAPAPHIPAIYPQLSDHTAVVKSVAFSPDGRTLALGGDGGAVKLWDMASGRELRALSEHTDDVNSVAFSFSPDDAVGSVAFSPDGRTLASGSDEGSSKLWDVATGRELRTLDRPATPDENVPGWQMSYEVNPVGSVAFSPDGKTLASGTGDGAITLWDVASGRERRSGQITGSVDSVAFSPDGRTLAGSAGGAISLWDITSGRKLRTMGGPSGAAQPIQSQTLESIAFSPDGRTLASGDYSDNTIHLWDVASGRELRTLSGHTDLVLSLVFSPDGRTLASSSQDKTIRLWDVASGRELRTLSGYAAAFSPDGKILAWASTDGTTKVWDASTGRERVSLAGFTDGSSIAVTPQGFFVGSTAQAEAYLNLRVGARVFGISSFRGNFYRPDLVARSMAGEDISQYGDIARAKLPP